MISENTDTGYWKLLPSNLAYMVSNRGEVYSLKTNKSMKLTPNLGYQRIPICHLGKRKMRTVHSLVLETFIGKRPDGLVINHKDGNRSNNHIDNLEYCTQSHNVKEDFRCGRHSLKGERNTQAKLTKQHVLKIRDMRDKGFKYREILEKFPMVTYSCIAAICIKNTWSHV